LQASKSSREPLDKQENSPNENVPVPKSASQTGAQQVDSKNEVEDSAAAMFVVSSASRLGSEVLGQPVPAIPATVKKEPGNFLPEEDAAKLNIQWSIYTRIPYIGDLSKRLLRII
jgi:hypothetical protein